MHFPCAFPSIQKVCHRDTHRATSICDYETSCSQVNGGAARVVRAALARSSDAQLARHYYCAGKGLLRLRC